MDFHNCTPFPALNFRGRTVDKKDFGVIVFRGTFSIGKDRSLCLSAEQQPLVLTDDYVGAPGESSLKNENSLAPYKPATDVVVHAHAWSPSGSPESEWLAGIQIGEMRKELLVTGPRTWTRSFTGWKLTPAARVASVPVDYEHAFGGRSPSGVYPTGCEENPVGIGAFTPGTTSPIPVPQLLPEGTKKLEFGKSIRVAGLGPVAPSWLPRRGYSGTFDDGWRSTRWPELPHDFSFQFYNTAATGLTLPGFARGNEIICLQNLTPEHQLVFQLPPIEPIGLLQLNDRRLIPLPIHLDTIQIDAITQNVFLTWRGIYPLELPGRCVEVRLDAPSALIDPHS